MTVRKLIVTAALLVLGVCVDLGCAQWGPRVISEREFDASGRVVALRGLSGRKTSFRYGSNGLLSEIASPDGLTHFGYDPNGNRIWARDKTGETQYYYDSFDRLSAVIWNRGPNRLISYQYDHVGLISRISLYNLKALAQASPFAARVARLQLPIPQDSSAWHQREQDVLSLADSLLLIRSPDSAAWLARDISYFRDLSGDLLEIRSEIGSVKFTRSDDGRHVERILPDGMRVISNCTEAGRLSNLRQVDSKGREVANYAFAFDVAGRLKHLSRSEDGGSAYTDYVWDPSGRLKQMNYSNGLSFQTRYDPEKRTVAVTGGGKAVTFAFDPLGRIRRVEGLAIGVRTGLLNARTNPRERTEIKYNDENLPIELRTRSTTVTFAWDSEGNLVSRSDNGKKVYFVPAAGTGLKLPLLRYGVGAEPERLSWRAHNFLRPASYGIHQYHSKSTGAGYSAKERGFAMLRFAGTTSEDFDSNDVWWTAFGQGLWASATAWRWNSREDVGLMDRMAVLNLTSGTFWGRAIGVSEMWASGNGGGFLQAGQDLGEALGALMVNQSARNWVNFGGATWNASMEVMSRTALGDAWNDFTVERRILKYVNFPNTIEHAIQNRFTDRIASQLAKQTYEEIVRPDLNLLLGSIGNLNRIIATSSRIVAKDFVEGTWDGSHKVLDQIEGTIEKAIDLRAELSSARADKVGPMLGHGAGRGYGCATPTCVGSSGYESATAALPTLTKKLGGVELSSRAEVVGKMGSIVGAVYDSTSRSIVLLSDDGNLPVSGLNADDFRVALRLAYSQAPEDAAFSLDPADPSDPDGPWLQKVYYPKEMLAGTAFGRRLFEADWLLKQYSFGVIAEQGRELRTRASAVDGYKSVPALLFDKGEDAKRKPDDTVRSRFWIVSQKMRIRRDGNSIVFAEATMGVKTKRQVLDRNSKTGLRDDESVIDPIHQEFAQRFSDQYDGLAKECPEFERVRDLAKAVAIGKWLRQSNVPIDLADISMDKTAWHADPEANEPVGALRYNDRKEDKSLVQTVEIFGGVDLKVNPQFLPDASLNKLRAAVVDKLRHSMEPRFTFTFETQKLAGTVIPLTHAGIEQMAAVTAFMRKGIADGFGNRARYVNAANGLADGIEVAGKDGWIARDVPCIEANCLNFTTARGNQIRAVLDSTRGIQRIDVDGKVWAEYHAEGKGRTVRLHQGNYDEILTYDSKGRVGGDQVEHADGRATGITEAVKIEYSAQGQPVRITGTGIPETRWQYDSVGRLEQMTSPDGKTLAFTYRDKPEQTIIESRISGAGQALERLVFEDQRLAASESPRSGVVHYIYKGERIMSIKGERVGQIDFSYDRQGRPKNVRMPSGEELEYRYPESREDVRSKPSEFKIELLRPRFSGNY